MKLLTLLFVVAVIPCCTCDEDMDLELLVPECGRLIEVLPEEEWPAGPNLNNARVVSVDGTCVEISYTWVGCSDQGRPLRLLTTGDVAESLPTQTSAQLRFSALGGPDPCVILEDQRDTFDVAPYIGTALPTRLTLLGADTTLLFE